MRKNVKLYYSRALNERGELVRIDNVPRPMRDALEVRKEGAEYYSLERAWDAEAFRNG